MYCLVSVLGLKSGFIVDELWLSHRPIIIVSISNARIHAGGHCCPPNFRAAGFSQLVRAVALCRLDLGGTVNSPFFWVTG